MVSKGELKIWMAERREKKKGMQNKCRKNRRKKENCSEIWKNKNGKDEKSEKREKNEKIRQ